MYAPVSDMKLPRSSTVFASAPTVRRFASLVLLATSATVACSDGANDTAVADFHDEVEGRPRAAASGLNANDTVATVAAANGCATSAVKGLSIQLLEEIQCLRPNALTSLATAPGFKFGSSVLPYLQTKAAEKLIAAQKTRGIVLSINSMTRSLAQQYLLYRWYETKACDIPLAARPGTSNHESATAVDVNDSEGWRTTLKGTDFRWLGASDAVHYDFVGAGTLDLRGLSVEAFQRLWNRNNPKDTIKEDGVFGNSSLARLALSPSGGFPKGADCSQAKPDAGDRTPTESPKAVPDAPEREGEPVTAAAEPEATGCASTPRAPTSPSSPVLAMLALTLVGVLRSRARRSQRA